MIEVLVGNIGSGKSTYAKSRARSGAIVVSEDSIVMDVHGGKYDRYHDDLKPLYRSVETTIFQLAVALHRDVIIDKTNMTRQQRARWITLAQSLDADVRCMWWRGPEKPNAISRRMLGDARGITRQKWEEVYDRKAAEFEEPRMEEGFRFIDRMGEIDSGL